MGTIIIYKGEAYLFEDKAPQDAVIDFYRDWFPNEDLGIEVYPLRGVSRKDGMMTTDTRQPGRWGSTDTEQA